MILFRVSKEHKELPLEEIRGICEAHDSRFEVLEKGSYLLIEGGPDVQIFAKRLAFSHEVFKVGSLTTSDELPVVLRNLPHKNVRSFSIDARDFGSNWNIQKDMGGVLAKDWGIPVSLKEPDLEIFLISLGSKIVVSTKRAKIYKGVSRDPHHRPYFHPTALNPKLAKLFINLARTKEGDEILDPFCGSGSILIEAGIMGMCAYGLDMDLEKIWGCKENLKHFKVDAEVREGNATSITASYKKEFDAIITDPPYARSSRVYGEGLAELYEQFLLSSKSVLKKGAFIVFAIPEDINITKSIEKAGFELLSKYRIYVHKSLSRMLYILRLSN